MVKNFIRALLQRLLGYDRYLFFFCLVNLWRMKRGGYERSFRYFISLLPNDGVLLDIGANIGVMTVYMARKCNKATVFAFEPIPGNARALKRVVKFFKLTNVKIFETALGDHSGRLTMVLPIVNHTKMQGWCHVVQTVYKLPVPGYRKWVTGNRGHFFDVPVNTLNEMEALQGIPKITAIKIDVENFEYYVFKGGNALLTRHRPLIYAELWNDDKRQWCIDLLQKLGYEAKIFYRNRLVVYEDQPAIDFFFLPAGTGS